MPHTRLPRALSSLLTALFLLAVPSLLADDSDWAGILFDGSDGHTIAKAKQYAYENQRPLLEVAGTTGCAHCKSLHDKVLVQSEFLQWAKEKRLVVCFTEDAGLYLAMKKRFRSIDGVANMTAPMVYLYEIEDTADFTDSSAKAFSEKNAELMEVTWTKTDPYCIKSYVAGRSFFNATIPAESSWTPALFESHVSKFFPNEEWDKNFNLLDDDDDPDDPDDDDPDDPVIPDDSGDDAWAGVLFDGSDEDHSLAKAKQYAYANKRPLLEVAGTTGCAHCRSLHDKVLVQEEFLQWAKEKRLVVCFSENAGLYLAMKKRFRSIDGVSNMTAPMVYLYEIEDTADFTDSSATAFSDKNAELMEVTWTNTDPDCVKSYVAGRTFFDVTIPAESNWTPALFESHVSKFFPNEEWDENFNLIGAAIDLGVVPSAQNPGETSQDWICTAPAVTFRGEEGEQLYKFQGRPGHRFYMYFDVSGTSTSENASAPYTYEVELYKNNNGIPADDECCSFEGRTFNAVNRGFFFDTPADSTKTLDTYYIEVEADDGTAASLSTFVLKIVEKPSNPAAGTPTNPLWSTIAQEKWTMETAKTLTAAYNGSKPILAYFTGVTWCPNCAYFEQMILDSKDFTDNAKDMYYLLLDNRKRTGLGPSLLTANFRVTCNGAIKQGYMTANGISETTATAKLNANKELQLAYALPQDSEKSGWGSSYIGYPTIVMFRSVPSGTGTGSDLTLEPVGRFTNSVTDVAATLTDLKELFALGYKETTGSSSTSIQLTGSSQQLILGKSVTSSWAQFLVEAGKSWSFAIPAQPNADEDASLVLSVWDSTGTSLLAKSESFSLRDAINYRFTPASSTSSGSYLLKVQIADQTSSFLSMELSYAQKQVAGTVSLQKTEMALYKSTTTLKVPLSLDLVQKDLENPNLKFSYSVQAASENGAPATVFQAVEKQEFTWPDVTQDSAFIEIPISAANKDWDEAKAIVVTIHEILDSDCIVSGNDETSAYIATYPCFLPEAEIEDHTLEFHVNVFSSFDIPVCVPADRNAWESNLAALAQTLPSGIAAIDNSNDSDNPRFTIQGVPTSTGTRTGLSLTLAEAGQGTPSDRYSFSVAVTAIGNEYAKKAAYTGTLRKTTTAELNKVEGCLLMKRTDNGFALTISTLHNQAFTTAVSRWNGYDSATKTLKLTCQLDDGAGLVVTMDSTGKGTVLYTRDLNTVYTGDIAPITDTPKEFQGNYNLSIRNDDSDIEDGDAQGWLQVAADDQGFVTVIAKLYGMQETITMAGCIATEDSYGAFPLFIPLSWSETENCYEACLSGELLITPASQRSTTKVDAWISGCSEKEFSLKGIPSNACGTAYDNTKSLKETVGESDFIFIVDSPAEQADYLFPSPLPIQEKAAATLAACGDSVFSTYLHEFTIDNTGRFTASLDILKVDANSLAVAPQTTTAQGVIIPTTANCCDATENIVIGYGSFDYDGNTYRIRIFPASKKNLTPLQTPAVTKVSTDDAAKTAVFQVSDTANPTLLQNLADGKLYAKIWSSSDNGTLILDATTPWTFSAASTGDANSQSAATAQPNFFGTQTYSYTLADGWNLVAVPGNAAIPADGDKPSTPVSNYDNTQKRLLDSDSLAPGKAYWIFADSKSSIPATALSYSATPISVSAKATGEGWTATAWSEELDSPWFWDQKNACFTLNEPNGVSSQTGVFIYLEPASQTAK